MWVLLLLLVAFLYLLFWPTDIKPVAWRPPKAPPLTGVYAVNNALSQVERIPVGGKGPEDVIFDADGRMVTGLEDGRIVRLRLDGSDLETLAHTDGRPLGMAVDAAGRVIVAHADLGLLAITSGGEPEVLVDHYQGRRLVFTNHLDIAKDGTIYFSETSDRFGYAIYKADMLEGRPNGRLFAYDPISGETRLLLEGLYFANGVALSPDESFLLVAETSRYRLRRLWLKGPQAGQAEIFIDNLPGFPDNLHLGSNGIFWAALVSPRKPELDAMSTLPPVKRLLHRLPASLQPKPTRYGFVLGIDSQGKVIHNLQDPTRDFGETTAATEHEGMLYLGSLAEQGIGRIPLPVLEQS